MDFDPTLHNVLELAIQTEQVGRKYYQRAARKFADDELVAALFRRLAADEQGHERTFRTILESLPADRRHDAQYERHDFLRAIAVSTFIRGDAFAALDEIDGVREALERAIEFEKSTMVYYEGVRDALGGGRALDLLIGEEMAHVTRLVEALVKLSD